MRDDSDNDGDDGKVNDDDEGDVECDDDHGDNDDDCGGSGCGRHRRCCNGGVGHVGDVMLL